MNAEKPSTLLNKVHRNSARKVRRTVQLQAWRVHCPINAGIGLLIANDVREFCYSFDHWRNSSDGIGLLITITFIFLATVSWHKNEIPVTFVTKWCRHLPFNLMKTSVPRPNLQGVFISFSWSLLWKNRGKLKMCTMLKDWTKLRVEPSPSN